MIKLRRNSNKDANFSASNDLEEGTTVALVDVQHFKHNLSTLLYVLPKNHKSNYHNYTWHGNCNCFDYVK